VSRPLEDVTAGDIRELAEGADEDEERELAAMCAQALAGDPVAWGRCAALIRDVDRLAARQERRQ
jgi:hypothetical protein